MNIINKLQFKLFNHDASVFFFQSPANVLMSKAGALSSVSYLKLIIPCGGATPSPPVGPALGQRGIKAIDFCRQFNDLSSKLYAPQTPLRCRVRVNSSDRSFSIAVRPPTTSWLLKRAAGIEKADSGREVARLPVQFVYEIAKIKGQDPLLQHVPLKRVFEMVVASAKSFGISLT